MSGHGAEAAHDTHPAETAHGHGNTAHAPHSANDNHGTPAAPAETHTPHAANDNHPEGSHETHAPTETHDHPPAANDNVEPITKKIRKGIAKIRDFHFKKKPKDHKGIIKAVSNALFLTPGRRIFETTDNVINIGKAAFEAAGELLRPWRIFSDTRKSISGILRPATALAKGIKDIGIGLPLRSASEMHQGFITKPAERLVDPLVKRIPIAGKHLSKGGKFYSKVMDNGIYLEKATNWIDKFDARLVKNRRAADSNKHSHGDSHPSAEEGHH